MTVFPVGQARSVERQSGGWERRREVMTAALEDIALRMFAERGYESVSYEDIAEVAGVSARTIYRYFPTKPDFLLAQPRRSLKIIEETLGSVGHSDQPLDDVIETMIMLSNEFHESLDSVILWYQAVHGAPEIESRIRGEQAAAWERLLVAFCADALDLDRDDVGAYVVAVTISAFNQSVVRYWVEGGGREELEGLYRRALIGLHRSFRTDLAT
jgi:AcrR family transcriptional regulator